MPQSAEWVRLELMASFPFCDFHTAVRCVVAACAESVSDPGRQRRGGLGTPELLSPQGPHFPQPS